uniref:Putative LOC101855726 [Aplysia californica] n=1 Tax=Lepeophtheirus salmonis TaxID=72036 RepID=A0A0K2TUK9_LEPSM
MTSPERREEPNVDDDSIAKETDDEKEANPETPQVAESGSGAVAVEEELVEPQGEGVEGVEAEKEGDIPSEEIGDEAEEMEESGSCQELEGDSEVVNGGKEGSSSEEAGAENAIEREDVEMVDEEPGTVDNSSSDCQAEVDPILDLDSVQEVEDSDDNIIKISAIASLSEADLKAKDEVVEIIKETTNPSKRVLAENVDCNGSSSNSPLPQSESTKKVGLKLASFAGMGRNGIADQTPVSGHCKISRCKQCSNEIDINSNTTLIWETMQFCNEKCLRNCQNFLNKCSSCKKTVIPSSVGKYCVRFGSNIKQFCSNMCLEEYKKGLKVCCYCQKDISGGEGFLAPIGDKGQFKDFCIQACLNRYEALHMGKVQEKEVLPCAVCSDSKPIEVELFMKDSSYTGSGLKTKTVKLCSNPCFSAFKFANSLDTSNCDFCSMPYDIHCSENVIYFDTHCKRFCSVSCQNVYVMKYRRIVPCQWCKVKKYNFDMIEKPLKQGTSFVYCSINCLTLHSITRKSESLKSVPSSPWNGNRCAPTVSNLVPPKGNMPVIQSVSSLAAGTEPSPMFPAETVPPPEHASVSTQSVKEVIKEYIVKCPEDIDVRNKATLTKPYMQTKGVSCRPNTSSKSTQTTASESPCILPVTVPFYMPVPMRMYSAPYPVPVPVPIPIPVPVFIPVKRNSIKGILKQIKKIQAKLPAHPYEAEVLAMAGAVADKDTLSESEGSVDDKENEDRGDDEDENQDEEAQKEKENDETQKSASNASMSDQTEDLEKEIAADKVVPKPLPPPTVDPSQNLPANLNSNITGRGKSGLKRRSSNDPEDEEVEWSSIREGDRVPRRPQKATRGRPPRSKQSRVDSSGNNDTVTFNQVPKERPDSKHHLKFTYGVNAWKHWVVHKNAEFEKGRSQGKYIKSFETDLLKLRADELNYTLCMFVKEVKKPNGDSYAPDSVLYLALGIQEYLFENGRIDNIFTDQYYETFTSTLHEVVKDFKLPVNELGYFVTRIEEEHLWESKQLGCHTPQVLLNTLIYLNTKYFMLKTCDEHAKLSFSHIMKLWKKTMTPGKLNHQRTVLLRFYPPSAKGRPDDKKCYEQHENTENPARCPVKYYEQYIAKCPESTKNDVFYLQPERSCVADSPLWFSNNRLSTHQLDKMLQRLLMVREIQEHMLADASSSSSS